MALDLDKTEMNYPEGQTDIKPTNSKSKVQLNANSVGPWVLCYHGCLGSVNLAMR